MTKRIVQSKDAIFHYNAQRQQNPKLPLGIKNPELVLHIAFSKYQKFIQKQIKILPPVRVEQH